MDRRWKKLKKLNVVLQILCGIATLSAIFWSARALVIDGLSAVVPAWLVAISVALGFVLGLVTRKLLKLNTSKIEQRQGRQILERLEFNFEDSDPKKHGWIVRNDPPNTVGPKFVSHTSGWYGRTLEVIPSESYYMDYELNAASSVARHIEIVLKPANHWAAYAKIRILNAQCTEDREAWIAIQIGKAKAKPFDWDNEWTVFLSPHIRDGGWVCLSIDLNDAVQQTYGKQGWKLDRLIGVRFRGHVELATVETYTR